MIFWPPSLCGISVASSFGTFPAFWRLADVSPIPKGPPPYSVGNDRPISITSSCTVQGVWPSGVGSPWSVIECWDVLPTNWFSNRKGQDTCDAILCMSHTLQNALEMGQEAKDVQIDFSAAFGRVQRLSSSLLCGIYRFCAVSSGTVSL